MRWTTGIGIALGGVGGAIAALMGTPKAAAPLPPAPRAAPAPEPAQPMAAPAAAAAPSAAPAEPAPAPSAAPVAAAAPLVAATQAAAAAPPLDIPATRDALLRAEMLCDQKKDFDQCARAAIALETATTGPADPEQAKRFRRIALTHLVAQCEVDSAHACFVLAAKYRAGTELPANPSSAEALEKRGAELCRLGRPAPECPTP
ncbi:MAG TPA: hypothetical protein VHP33_38345 [Polyangiaceae bacterium]|nr:hypothetical protein [Polyangiaceae bacterium]